MNTYCPTRNPLSLQLTRRQATGLVAAFCISGPVVAGERAGAGFREIAYGIFVRRGADAEATRDNVDAIANAGFVIGNSAVCVTDPGGSLSDGRSVRRAIRRYTHLPITHVVLNHDHPDHIFGAAAFRVDRPVFVGHDRLAQSLATRGEYDRKRLASLIGDAAAGMWTAPTVGVHEPLLIDLGGRALTVTAHPPAHSRCDLSIVDSASGILFAGDLLFVDRIPALSGSLLGWINTLKALRSVQAVPGHGPVLVDFAPAAARMLTYLAMLRDETRAAIANRVPIDTAARTIGQSARGDWRLFRAYHAGNVIKAYRELEWE